MAATRGGIQQLDEKGEFLSAFQPGFNPVLITDGPNNDLFFFGNLLKDPEKTSGIWHYDILTDKLDLRVPIDLGHVNDIDVDDQGNVYAASNVFLGAESIRSVRVFDGATGSQLGAVENVYPKSIHINRREEGLKVVVNGSFPLEPQYVRATESAPLVDFSIIESDLDIVFDLNGSRYQVLADGATRTLRHMDDQDISYPLSGLFAGMTFDDKQNLYYFDYFSGIQRVSVDGQTQKIDRPAEHQSPVTDMQYVPFLSRVKTGGEEKPPLTIRDITRLTREVFDGRVRDELDFDVSGSVRPGELIRFLESEGVSVGDIDLDGTFGSIDLINLFQQGRYEAALAVDSDWSNGDFNGDRQFTNGDLNLAFEAGDYEQTPPRGARGVPEPSGLALLLCGYIVALAYRRAGK
jgi:hypothetical protein